MTKMYEFIILNTMQSNRNIAHTVHIVDNNEHNYEEIQFCLFWGGGVKYTSNCDSEFQNF